MDNLPRKRRADFQLSPYAENTNIKQTDTSINKPTDTNQEIQRKRARARPLNEHKDIPTLKGIFKNINIPSEINMMESVKGSVNENIEEGMKENGKENRIAGLNKSFVRALEYVINVESSKNLIFLFEQYKKFLKEIENEIFTNPKEKPFSELKDEKKSFFSTNNVTDSVQKKDNINPFSNLLPPSVDRKDSKDSVKDNINPFSNLLPPSVDSKDSKYSVKDNINPFSNLLPPSVDSKDSKDSVKDNINPFSNLLPPSVNNSDKKDNCNPFFNLLNHNSPSTDLSILKEPEDSSKSSFCDQNIFQLDSKKIDSNNFQNPIFSPGLNKKTENKNLNDEKFTENITRPDKKRVSFDLSRNEELNNSTFHDSSFMKSDDSFSLTKSPQNNIFISSSPKTLSNTVTQPFTFYDKHNVKDILASSLRTNPHTTPNPFTIFDKHNTKEDITTTSSPKTTPNPFKFYDSQNTKDILSNNMDTPDIYLQPTNEYLLNNKLQSQNISLYHLNNTKTNNEYILLGKPYIYLKNNFLTIFYSKNKDSIQLFKNKEIQNISIKYTNGDQFIVIGVDNDLNLYKIFFDNFKDISVVLENLNKK
ncbi:hypothetical protein CWI36_0912p0020 [Hamiltosporidium magnivora]|uniref:Uncharacterized protein n=1 Tax=Hamiltosporidium magnivora TaxID=148818 RepID=A0A4Q9L790_9MICR|nr:hypothetical protein CWI36_0912p0020 [Hamiltosporidium magnivora]